MIRVKMTAIVVVIVAVTGFIASYAAFYSPHYTVSDSSITKSLVWGNGTGPKSNAITTNVTGLSFINQTHSSSYFEVFGHVGSGGLSGVQGPFIDFEMNGWVIGHLAGNLRPSGIRVTVNNFGNNTNNYSTVIINEFSHANNPAGYKSTNGSLYLSPYAHLTQEPVNVSGTVATPWFAGFGSLNLFASLQNEPLFSSSYYNFMMPFYVQSIILLNSYSNGTLNLSVHNTLHVEAFLLGLGGSIHCSMTFILISSDVMGIYMKV